jgi:DNA helicase II / ATP-dependent DNA helicase PcrA
MPHQISITEEDVTAVAKMVLPEGETFDNERINFIKALNTIDIQACPGSGKTTCLLAKLLLLGRNLPFADNSGILVLSHTNAAVDGIKHKILRYCPDLFKYPNFVGTIQGFVDGFLAIPYYAQEYDHLPCRIDDEIFGERINKLVCLPKHRTLSLWLDNHPKKNELLQNLRFDSNNNLVTAFSLPQGSTKSYQSLVKIKNDLLAEGYLCFEDAYYLAECYINAFPKVIDLIRKRFSFVFIDEMQDTDSRQIGVLDRLFPADCQSVVQRIGDQNQAIYSRKVKSDTVWTPRSGFLTLNGSKRLSESIASTIKNISLNPQDLVGNSRRQRIKPKLILFDDGSIKKVSEKFGDLIIASNLHRNKEHVFKAIGWRKTASENGGLTIGSYFEKYLDVDSKNRPDHNNIKDYLLLNKKTIDEYGFFFPYKSILNALIKILRVAGIKRANGQNYTVQSLLMFLKESHEKEYEELKLNLLGWSLKIYEAVDVYDEITQYITVFLTAVFSYNTTPITEVNSFLVAPQAGSERAEAATNIYKYKNGDTNIDVEIGTIHSVKGETHTGTLYLETHYYNDGGKSYESQRLLNQLKGCRVNGCGVRVKESLKMAYVGMSRPTHLLCFAAHKSHIPDNEIPSLEDNWEIVRIYEGSSG